MAWKVMLSGYSTLAAELRQLGPWSSRNDNEWITSGTDYGRLEEIAAILNRDKRSKRAQLLDPRTTQSSWMQQERAKARLRIADEDSRREINSEGYADIPF